METVEIYDVYIPLNSFLHGEVCYYLDLNIINLT